MSNELTALVIEMMRHRRAEEKDKKDKAYDMWKIRENQQFQEKLTKETRQYNLEHGEYVVSKEKETEALKLLDQTEQKAVELGVNMDLIQDLYTTSNNDKVVNDLVIPEMENLSDLTDYYRDKAEQHKEKLNILNEVIYNDIARADQIMAGGRGDRGKGFGTDTEGWDAADLGLASYIDKYEMKTPEEFTEDFGIALGMEVYGKDVTDEQVNEVTRAYAIANNPDATYVDSLGNEVKVGGTDMETVLSDILKVNIDQIPSVNAIDSLKDMIGYTKFDADYEEGKGTAEEIKDRIVKEYFDEKSGTINISLEKLQKSDVTSQYQQKTTELTDLKIEKYEHFFNEKEADKARNRLYNYRRTSEVNTKLDDYYNSMLSLTKEGGVEDLSDDQINQHSSNILEIKTKIATDLMKATDYDAFSRWVNTPEADKKEEIVEQWFDEYEKILQLTDPKTQVRYGQLSDMNFREMYAYLKQSMENYEEASGTAKMDVMMSIMNIFGVPSTVNTEEDFINWYNEFVNDYGLTIGSPVSNNPTITKVFTLDDDEDEDDDFDFSGYGGTK